MVYEHDYDYLALSFNQCDFVLLKECNLKSCSTGILTMFSINVPLYDAKLSACEAELFFQMSGKTTACIIAANGFRTLPELHGTS
jgi:glutamate synthase domain-containing protein 2